MAKGIFSQELVDALVRARVVDDPRYVRRVVLDIQVGEPVKVYVERYTDDNTRLVDVIKAVGIEIQREGGQ
jgi:hypothetical protein